MLEWIQINWASLLGTGGIGIILVAVINVAFKSKSKDSINQKLTSKGYSSNYQSGRDININQEDKKNDK